MSSAKSAVALARICSRQYCSIATGKASSNFKPLKVRQARFQCDDGLPVFLKGGLVDKMLYQATWLTVFVGSGMMLKLFWDLAVPKK